MRAALPYLCSHQAHCTIQAEDPMPVQVPPGKDARRPSPALQLGRSLQNGKNASSLTVNRNRSRNGLFSLHSGDHRRSEERAFGNTMARTFCPPVWIRNEYMRALAASWVPIEIYRQSDRTGKRHKKCGARHESRDG